MKTHGVTICCCSFILCTNNYQLEPLFDSPGSNWYLFGRTYFLESATLHVSTHSLYRQDLSQAFQPHRERSLMQLSHVHLQKEKSHHRIQRQITFRPKPHFAEKIPRLTGISWFFLWFVEEIPRKQTNGRVSNANVGSHVLAWNL